MPMYTKPMTSEDHEKWLEMMGESTEETKERIKKVLAVINCYQARCKTSKQPLSLLSARRLIIAGLTSWAYWATTLAFKSGKRSSDSLLLLKRETGTTHQS